MVDNDFLKTFLDEAQETLENWESACLQLEKESSQELLNDLFRSAHNIKGSSKSVGLVDFGNLVHKAEDLITKLKNSELSVNSEIISSLLECQKILSIWIEELKENPNFTMNTDEITQKLVSFNSTIKTALQSTVDDDGFGFFDDENSIINDSGDVKKDLGTILIEQGKATQEQVDQAAKVQNQKLGEILVSNGVTSKESIKAALEVQKKSGLKSDDTIRVSIAKLDSVIRLIGELSIQHSIIKNAKEKSLIQDQAASEAVNLSHKAIQDLQSEAMSLRMQSLEGLFQRMERVCRDVAKQLNKKIQVVLKGFEVELDKTVIEKMKDPLVHILRNAVDHGIEDKITRLSSGKNEIATITIEGTQTASNVTITISDDGQGLNEGKILKKAQDKSLIPPDHVPTPEEIHQLIFHPGFSTAEQVTDVSGRGVGMDVVKTTVDEIGGSIHIDSSQGKGTKFSISLPSTLSILDAVVVNLDNKLYAVPIQDIEEVVDLSTTQTETSTQQGKILNLRGRILPVEKLRSYLPTSKDNIHYDASERGIALITRHQNQSVAFEVNKIEGQQSIVVRQLEGNLAEVPGFSGGTILANGEPAMIINPPQIVKSYLQLSRMKG